jgi:hypothetical protein
MNYPPQEKLIDSRITRSTFQVQQQDNQDGETFSCKEMLYMYYNPVPPSGILVQVFYGLCEILIRFSLKSCFDDGNS